MLDRLLDPQTFSLILLVGLFLAVLYLLAVAVKEHRRRTERIQLESALREREILDEPAPPPETPPPKPVPPPRESSPLSAAPPVPPAIAPPEPNPRPRFLLTWTPPAADPPRFRQYLTWPGTKITTPLVEQPPSDQDYVWQ